MENAFLKFTYTDYFKQYGGEVRMTEDQFSLDANNQECIRPFYVYAVERTGKESAFLIVRKDESERVDMAFAVIDDVVFEVPTLFNVVSYNVDMIMEGVVELLDLLDSSVVEIDPFSGHVLRQPHRAQKDITTSLPSSVQDINERNVQNSINEFLASNPLK